MVTRILMLLLSVHSFVLNASAFWVRSSVGSMLKSKIMLSSQLPARKTPFWGDAALLAVIPLELLKLDKAEALKKSLVGGPHVDILSMSKLRALVSRTPFCLVAEHLSLQNYCIVANQATTEANFAAITLWISSHFEVGRLDVNLEPTSFNHSILLCKKGHLVNIGISS